jgi:hypothetical protein
MTEPKNKIVHSDAQIVARALQGIADALESLAANYEPPQNLQRYVGEPLYSIAEQIGNAGQDIRAGLEAVAKAIEERP